MLTVLCISDDEDLATFLSQVLTKSGYAARTAPSLEQGLKILAGNSADTVVLLSDLQNTDWEAGFHKIRSCQPRAQVVLYGEGDNLPNSVLRLLLGRVSKTDVSGLLLLLARVASEQRDIN